MRPIAATLALGLLASPLAAQSREDPSLAFTISGGMSAGGDLWRIDRQPLAAPGTAQDTVGLARRLRPGIAASLGMSFFRSPHVGLNFEVAYFGLGSEQTCEPPAAGFVPNPDNSESINSKACTNAHGQHTASGAIGFLAGGTYRFLDPQKVQAYVRVNAGVALLSNSFVQTVGLVHDTACVSADNICPYQILSERNRQSATWLVSLAGGFSYYLGPGYRVRMEGRDLLLTLPIAAGPAVPGSTGNFPPIKHVVKHIPVFMIGFDVLLERRHTRRY